ncbi:uncharacterized protein RAG0_11161 [Rhynchosporium agropyri]|uniref:Uncharacterized protein n=1 Tax=Rhynchosporium agropyri TaxID=914238 RepID=A0A1E1L5F5_9HELO|nr:uncharacterized protein RAG0_11161 [Rhynchosporium agropyri]
MCPIFKARDATITRREKCTAPSDSPCFAEDEFTQPRLDYIS